MDERKRKVVLADDHQIVREGIQRVVESVGNYVVVGEAERCAEVLPIVQETRPDLLLLDMSLADGNSLHLIDTVLKTSLQTRVVVLSVDSSIAAIHQSFQRGAHGYLSKTSGSRRLIEALDAVMCGELYSDGVVSEVLLRNVRVPGSADKACSDPLYNTLSGREQQVLHLMARGCTTKEIAVDLHISPKTVETHRLNMYTKLEINDPIELIRYASRIGVIDPADWISNEATHDVIRGA